MVVLLREFQSTGNYSEKKNKKEEEKIILVQGPLCPGLFCLWELLVGKGCVKPVQQE